MGSLQGGLAKRTRSGKAKSAQHAFNDTEEETNKGEKNSDHENRRSNRTTQTKETAPAAGKRCATVPQGLLCRVIPVRRRQNLGRRESRTTK